MNILVSEIEAERGLDLLCRVGETSRWLPAYLVPGVVAECDVPVTLPPDLAAELMFDYEERSAIKEYDGRIMRSEAETQAARELGLSADVLEAYKGQA